MATYSINTGTPYESTFLGNLDPNLFLNQIPNNTAQLIVPEDVRDSLYTIWDNVAFKQVTAPGSSIEYIGIKGNVYSDNYDNGGDGLKVFIGKPDLSNVSIMNNNLIGYDSGNINFPDSDIIFYNFKPDDYGGGGTDQQFTKISFLAGDPSNGLFNTSPYILSQENSGGTAINMTIYNEGGKITIDSNDELIIGSSNTKITLLYGTGSTGIQTLPGGNPGDLQINVENCEFGAINGASASLGNVLIMGASNSPYWGSLAIDNVFTLNQILTSGNQTTGKDIILNTNDSIYLGGTGSTYGRIYHNGNGSFISTTDDMTIDVDGTFRLEVTGIGANKALLTDGSGNAYWGTQSVSGGGSGTPGGSDTHIQYNDSGSFSGSGSLIWNYTNSSLRINGATVNRAISVIANSVGGFELDTNDTNQAFVVNDSSATVLKIRTDPGSKVITWDQGRTYSFVWGGNISAIKNRFTFRNTIYDDKKHICLEDLDGSEFRIDYLNNSGVTSSMISFGASSSYGAYMGVIDSNNAGLVFGSHNATYVTNPSMVIFPNTVSQSDLSLESSKIPILIGSGIISNPTSGDILSGDDKRALGINIVPEVDFHLNGIEANVPQSMSLLFYGPYYSIPSNITSSIITLDNTGDAGRSIGRVGNTIDQRVASYGTKIKLINRAGPLLIHALNGALSSSPFDDTASRNIFIPEHYGTTNGGPLPYDATTSTFTFNLFQTLEMVYLPVGGANANQFNGIDHIANEGGYWLVTSVT